MTQPDPSVNQSSNSSIPSSDSVSDAGTNASKAENPGSDKFSEAAKGSDPSADLDLNVADLGLDLEAGADKGDRPKYTGPQPILSTNEPVLSPALNRYECKSCGYIYEPQLGDGRAQIAKNTAFVDVPDTWRCSVCGGKKSLFVNIGPGGQPSGFEENLGYGMGVNTLSPAAKNLLIFGSLGAALAMMLSLYGLR